MMMRVIFDFETFWTNSNYFASWWWTTLRGCLATPFIFNPDKRFYINKPRVSFICGCWLRSEWINNYIHDIIWYDKLFMPCIQWRGRVVDKLSNRQISHRAVCLCVYIYAYIQLFDMSVKLMPWIIRWVTIDALVWNFVPLFVVTAENITRSYTAKKWRLMDFLRNTP